MSDHPAITLTVAVCTYNRAGLLPRALDSILSQTMPPSGFDILVVDNGSSDSTREVVSRYQRAHPHIHLAIEERPGIAHARNTAIQIAQGEYVAFLDDDAWAGPGWLEALLTPVRTLRPPPACVVGPVVLSWEPTRPPWIPEAFEPLFCRYDMGLEPRYLGADSYLLTTNVLFHRRTIDALGGFRPYLGRRRGSLLGGEDNDIYQRLVDVGAPVFYTPRARVRHGVSPDRQTKGYLLRRVFWDGASQPLIDVSRAQVMGNAARPWPEAYRDLRRCAHFASDIAGHTLSRRPEARWASFLALIRGFGRLRTHVLLGMGRGQ